MNISLKVVDKGFESCFRSILLLPSGPATFFTESECKVSSISYGFVCMDSSQYLFLEVDWGNKFD